MILDHNFGEIEEKTLGEYLPEGQFECKCVKASWGKSKNGTLYLSLTWECIEPGDFLGLQATERKYLTPNTLPYVKGWSHNLGVLLDGKGVNEEAYVGRFALLKIKEVDNPGYDNKKREISSWSSPANANKNKTVSGSAGASKITPHDIKEDMPSSSSSSHESEAPMPSDNDVPF
jgi:hypothetical protein